MIATLAAAHGLKLLSIIGRPVNVAIGAPLLVGVLLIVAGSVMGRLRPNWFFGIRTPWTMSSEVAWTRTHRLGGLLFMLVGALSIATHLLLGRRVGFIVTLGGPLVLVIWSLVYSYRVWRDAPDKTAPTGSLPQRKT